MAFAQGQRHGHWAVATLLTALILLNSRWPNLNEHKETVGGKLVEAADAFDWFRSLVGSSSSATSTTSSPPADLEREASVLASQTVGVRTPAQIVRSNFRNGRYTPLAGTENSGNPFPMERDLFKCVEPSASMYRRFVRQYERKFEDDTERLERLNLFAVTFKRSILFNRIVQNEITNATNYQLKPEIGDYHFVEPVTQQGENVGAIWYADITDCELGLIKHIIFNIMSHIDKNDFNMALKLALESNNYLPLFLDDGFEQLANILLLRLYDRFRGDEKMDQLFRWPLYLKKLAAYAYGLRESMRPNFKGKLALVSFAYPAYFKDVKYNWPAINRTGDNLQANHEHNNFNSILKRNFVNLRELNKRLVIFRQHWSLINQLNDNPETRFRNTTLESDWDQISEAQFGEPKSEKLIDPANRAEANKFGSNSRKFKITQFSDLTDDEFVAFLTNDYESLLGNKRDSQLYLMQNFQVRHLDDQLRDEIALELEFRRATVANLTGTISGGEPIQLDGRNLPTKAHSLSRQVVDELISDVGLPIGPVSIDNINEQEFYSAFTKITSYTAKSYLSGRNSFQQAARFVEPSGFGGTGSIGNQLTDSDLADERQRRYETFKENYARFKAWFLKEGWSLNEQQSISMLRFADLSWHDIKLTLFKVCCLTDTNLETLSRENATIQYLASNYQTFCQQMQPSESIFSINPQQLAGDLSSQNAKQQQQQQDYLVERQTSEMTALELYYYYCVHFNKHHSNQHEFERKFNIFKKNIDSIRRHSCKRDLTLFNSLRLRQAQTLNTIDVLDQRRSYTDDLNLDRFEYFNIPPLVQTPNANLLRSTSQWSPPASSVIDTSRAGISYRRAAPNFAALLAKEPAQVAPTIQTSYSYADKLLDWNENVNEFALRYRRLGIGRIYDFVMQRYRYCMKSLKGIDLDGSELRQQCQPSGGKFEDKAASLGSIGTTLWTQDENFNLSGQNRIARLQQQDQCNFYRLGLEPWSEGLVRQDALSAQLIQTARCQPDQTVGP